VHAALERARRAPPHSLRSKPGRIPWLPNNSDVVVISDEWLDQTAASLQ
jgi:hypothetical protein